MGVLEVIEDVVTKVAGHVHNKLKTNKANRRLAKEVEASVACAVRAGKSPYEVDFRHASLQEVLAMLVDGVYYRDHSGIDLDVIVKPLIEGEYEVDQRMAHFTSSLYWTRMASISEEEEKDAGIKHYVRHHRNPNATSPSLVIAIRGTKLSSCQDLVDDIKIAMSTLHFSSRFKQGRDLVKKIIEEFVKWQRGYDDDSESSDTELASRSVGPPTVHQDFYCDVCNMKPIIGPRYESNKEENYDLCQKCFQKHGTSKDYTQIDKRLGKLQFQQPGYDDDDDDDDSQLDDDSESDNDMKLVLNRPVLKPAALVQHPRVQCDECKRVPIVGIRYKSNKKLNYDLCQECFQEHGALKDYTKIDKPLESTWSSSSSTAMGDDIYITGHSLGAALALQIGKTLAAEEKQRYHVHCFNPPFLTIVQLIQEGIFLGKAKKMLRKSPLEPLINAASHVKNLTKLTVAMIMDNEDQLVEEVKHFMNLTDWVPVLYINAHDRICSKFRKHYKQKQKVSAGFEVCSQALLSRVLGHRALFSSLVPSVDMRVSKRPDKSHDLKNWYREPAIDKYRQYRLLGGVFVAGLPIDALAKAILYHSDPDSDEEEEEDFLYI